MRARPASTIQIKPERERSPLAAGGVGDAGGKLQAAFPAPPPAPEGYVFSVWMNPLMPLSETSSRTLSKAEMVDKVYDKDSDKGAPAANTLNRYASVDKLRGSSPRFKAPMRIRH